ncbi:MAG: tRNA (adenosine(37)-N6)-dimethylallyltransferase MiaA, partial [Oscillospiraceae bacterium]
MDKIPVIVIVGPTASGKTALSVELAKLYNGEIVSADSMQIYKGMDIATAKPTRDEKQGIPDHMMSCVEINRSFSVADYVGEARAIIENIHSRGRLSIIVGGTGLYINSLIDNISFDDTASNSSIRKRLLLEASEKGNAFLLDRLMKIDPDTACTLHENNLMRIIRALEVYEISGIKMSEQKLLSRSKPSPYNPC